jgi:hypothetical protein
MINLLRTELKDKPMSAAMLDDARVFKKVIKEMARLRKEKEFEELAKTDTKKKLGYFMLKVKHKNEREQEALEESILNPS